VILTALMAHQRKLIRKAVAAMLIAANTAAAARVSSTRVDPIAGVTELPTLSVYSLSEEVDKELSDDSAPRELTRMLKLEIAGWVQHRDSYSADDAMDDLAEQVEAVMDVNWLVPAALAISAVDHTTGQFTIAAHGLATGDRLLGVSVVGGGVLPAGFALGGREPYAIVVDPNTIKLASSSAAALAGTALAFTDNGTLPLQLLVARVADSILESTVMEVAEDDGKSDPLVGIVLLTYSVTYRTSPAEVDYGDFNTVDAKYPPTDGVADTVPLEDTFNVQG